MKAIIDAQDRKIKSLEKSIQLKDLSLAEADLKIQVCETRITERQVFLFFLVSGKILFFSIFQRKFLFFEYLSFLQ